MHAIISTVGTSLFTNAKRNLGDKLDLANPYETTKHQLWEYLSNTNVIQASAETHALYWLGFNPSEKKDMSGSYLFFLHSETPMGELCASVLSQWYHDNFFVITEAKLIKNLQSRDPKAFGDDGMINLIKEIARIVKAYRSPENRVIINATGGFKPEAAYASIMGFLLGAEVVYVHEFFQRLVVLPPLPNDLTIVGNQDTKKRIHQILNSSSQEEANQLYSKLTPSEKMLIERRENFLNPNNSKVDYHLTVLGEFINEISPTEKIVPREIKIHTGERDTHSTLWGDKIRVLSDVPNLLFVQGMLEICERFQVKELLFTRFSPNFSKKRFEIRDIKKHDLGITLDTYCPSGFQQVVIKCESHQVEKWIQQLQKMFPLE
ncbi:MAG: putative CRISPR-associated protein, partial [bacterium]|nr:putative CRISPR-associated protein [bacterium]